MQTCANASDELWPKAMGRKSEKASMLQFDGFVYGISLFLVLSLNLLNYFFFKVKLQMQAKLFWLKQNTSFYPAKKFDFLQCLVLG